MDPNALARQDALKGEYEFTQVQRLVNEGAVIRYTTDGIGVLMAWRLPGIWFDEHGRQVGPKIARLAGYDVDALLVAKKKREAIAKATEAIEQEYNTSSARQVVAEKNGYKVVGYGLNRFNVEYGDTGEAINTKGFITDEATALKTLDAVASLEDDKEV